MQELNAACAFKAIEQPSTAFQDATRGTDIPLWSALPLSKPLMPIVDELRNFIDQAYSRLKLPGCFDGSWATISLMPEHPELRQAGGSLLARLPKLAELFADLGGQISLAQITRIAPGDLLDWHFDHRAADLEKVRLHIPIFTHQNSVTEFCHERCFWPVGSLYYGDYAFPHRVFNTGETERIHLYFDLPADAIQHLLPPIFFENVDERRMLRTETLGLHMKAKNEAHLA